MRRDGGRDGEIPVEGVECYRGGFPAGEVVGEKVLLRDAGGEVEVGEAYIGGREKFCERDSDDTAAGMDGSAMVYGVVYGEQQRTLTQFPKHSSGVSSRSTEACRTWEGCHSWWHHFSPHP